MRTTSLVLCVAFGLTFATPRLSAHHSFAAEYDGKKPIQLQGVVTKIDWENPHVYVYLDVKDDAGKVVNWALEGHPEMKLSKPEVRPTLKGQLA